MTFHPEDIWSLYLIKRDAADSPARQEQPLKYEKHVCLCPVEFHSMSHTVVATVIVALRVLLWLLQFNYYSKNGQTSSFCCHKSKIKQTTGLQCSTVEVKTNNSQYMKTEKIIYCLLKMHLTRFHKWRYKDSLLLWSKHFHYIDWTKVEEYCIRSSLWIHFAVQLWEPCAETEAAHTVIIFCFQLVSLCPLGQADLACKHGDQKYDGEPSEQPCILDQEEDDLGRSLPLFPCYAVHLWKLKWGIAVILVQQQSI